MLKIAFDPVYIHPLPEGHRFPMIKYELIPEQLLHDGSIGEANLFSPGEPDEEAIIRTHDPAYWTQLKTLTLPPAAARRIGFPLSAGLVEREIRIVQGTIDCCRYALQHGVALNVAGGTHHAFTDRGGGFCLLNDQAVAAGDLLAGKLARRILIIDLDVHQGDGTAAIFSRESRVFTFSMHGAGNYPYQKEKSDLDIALADGTGDDLYLSLLKKVLPELIEKHRPDFVFYQSGVDVLKTDKLGKLSLSREGCRERDALVFEQCIRYQLPVVASMGGGYSPRIADIVHAHCNTFRLAGDLFF